MPNRTHITGSEKQLVVSDLNRNQNVKGKSQMSKKRAGAVFIMFLTCGLITQAFAQGQEPKFNSNAR